VTIFEEFHSIGYVYNDLKPDNVCIGIHRDMVSLKKLKLIDFGLATPYLLENGKHMECKTKEFQGNLAFSSKNAFR
jgi:serine/threonine protein kinase